LPEPKVNIFQGNNDYYVFLVYAQGIPVATKQDYKIYVGGTDVKKGTSAACTAGATGPKPYLIRADISVSPSRITPKPGDAPAFTFPWTWCYNETGNEPGVLTVHIDMAPFAAELSPKPIANYNSQCQPQTFCAVGGTMNSCGCNLKSNDPMLLANPNLKKECDDACGTWAVKDLDCPLGGCFGFGVRLPASFDPSQGTRPAAACFPQTTAWKTFTPASSAVAGTQCTYTPPFKSNFCP
jgi:hypothetical protein